MHEPKADAYVATMANKYTIRDACRSCHSIRRTVRPAVFFPNSTDLLYLRVTKVPRCGDLVIFWLTTMTMGCSSPHLVIMNNEL